MDLSLPQELFQSELGLETNYTLRLIWRMIHLFINKCFQKVTGVDFIALFEFLKEQLYCRSNQKSTTRFLDEFDRYLKFFNPEILISNDVPLIIGYSLKNLNKIIILFH